MEKAKKIGVCACYTNHNYGSMLQSYATVSVLQRAGFECELIRYRKKKNLRFVLKSLPRVLNRITRSDKYLVIQKKINMKRFPKAAAENAEREEAFEQFQNKYFTMLSPVYYGYDALREGAGTYDCVVSGSDQVWSPSALATHFYDLTFVPDNVLKASYASSFGVKQIPWYQIKRTKEYLDRIEFISVREASGQKIVKEISGKDVPLVCDPTFLLTAEEWDEIIPRKQIETEPYVFAYFLGASPEHRKAVTEFARSKGLKLVTIHHMDQYVPADEGFGDAAVRGAGPEEFVNLIRFAQYVCTDSFHGTIFSLLNRKEFAIFNRYSDTAADSKNSRIESLCGSLGVEGRRFHGNLEEIMQTPVDYDAVEPRARAFRESSKDYIHSFTEKI